MVTTVRKQLDEAFAAIEKPQDLSGGLDNVYSADRQKSSTSAAPAAQAELTTT